MPRSPAVQGVLSGILTTNNFNNSKYQALLAPSLGGGESAAGAAGHVC